MADGSVPVEEPVLTAKREAFARAFVETGNATEAYRRSYNVRPDTNPQNMHVNASKLLADAKVKQRVDELRAAAAERTEITLLDIAQMLKDAHSVGSKGGDASAMTEAAMSLAKLLGHYTEKKHVTSDNRNHNVEERVSPSSEWLEGMLGSGAQAKDKGSRPN